MKIFGEIVNRFLFVIIFLSLIPINYSCKDSSCPTDDSREKVEMTLDTFKVAYEIVPVKSDSVYNLAYEIDLSNYQFNGYKLVKAEAIDGVTNKILRCIEGEEITMFLKPASIPLPSQQEMTTGTSKLPHPRVLFWIKVTPANLPTAVKHRFTFKQGKGDDNKLYVAEGAYKAISSQQPIAIGPPFVGSNWYPIETTADDTHHFLGQFTYGGVIKVGQRFACDWIRLDPLNTSFHKDDGLDNEDWYCYGADLLAVGDGVVSDIKNGIVENNPVGTKIPINMDNVGGNYVIIKLSENRYACYAHIIPGTIKVNIGDNVKKGDVIAKLGNSGNSDCPHLHFQIVDGNSFLSSEGFPYVFSEFEVEANTVLKFGASIQDLRVEVQPVSPPKKHYNELMERYDIIKFY